MHPFRIALCALALAAGIPAATAQAPRAVRLRCEYLTNPIGIDVRTPRLAWQMSDPRRGAAQTAWRIAASATRDGLLAGRSELWDSGRVASNQTLNVAWRGRPLTTGQRVWWRVTIWDAAGAACQPSEPAWFELGLLTARDWRARWIGLPTADSQATRLGGAAWIWFPEGSPAAGAPAATRWFRAAFEAPAGKTVRSAILVAAADNAYTAYINGRRAAEAEGWETLRSSDVARRIRPGRNVIAIAGRNNDGPAGLIAAVNVEFTDGTRLSLGTGADWRTANEQQALWNSPGFDDSGWKQAVVVAPFGGGPWSAASSPVPPSPAPLLRREFAVRRPVARARLYVTALGSYRVHINGARVGRGVLTPDWTDYRKHILYQTYDVTGLVRRGANAIGAIVGDGWYASGLGWNLQRFCFGPPPVRLLAQLRIEYADGSSDLIATDRSWRGATGPVLRSEIYAGETYDAQLEKRGWDRAGAPTAGWQSVREFPAPKALLTAQISPTIEVTQQVKPLAITTPAPGVTVYDMGQNMVGWVRLKVRGPAGTAVRLRFAERLQPNGQIYTENLRRAEATDTYTLRGGAEETFEPLFTYHGFRFVEITGFPGTPGRDTILGQVVHTANAFTSRLATDSALVNRIFSNINWGQRGNLHSVPTDCPQRDERLGWMGDACVFWPTACTNMDMAAFTRKWTRDVVEAQSPKGGYSDVSPRAVDEADGAPAWGDAGIHVPWTAFRRYGDLDLIRENWPAMERWMHYIQSENPEMLWLRRRNNDFGDWVPANSDTPKDVLASAFWAHDALIMAEMARALGRKADAAKYDRIYSAIRAAFNARYVTPEGKVGNGSQTCQVLALWAGLLPEALRGPAADVLAADIASRDTHLSTGFIGTSQLMNMLTEYGKNEVAYRLVQTRTYPGWGYTIDRGATTIWERWNGDTEGPGMNSYNHYSFGAVGDWMLGHMAGIACDPATPGFGRAILRPSPGPGLNRVTGAYDSVRGTITSAWQRLPGGAVRYNLVIPANTRATVSLPASGPQAVTEGGKPAANAPGLRFLRMQGDRALFEAAAGAYRFEVR